MNRAFPGCAVSYFLGGAGGGLAAGGLAAGGGAAGGGGLAGLLTAGGGGGGGLTGLLTAGAEPAGGVLAGRLAAAGALGVAGLVLWGVPVTVPVECLTAEAGVEPAAGLPVAAGFLV